MDQETAIRAFLSLGTAPTIWHWVCENAARAIWNEEKS